MATNSAPRGSADGEASERSSAAPVTLDPTDQGIVAALERNGRASFRNIATQVGVSEATVRNRYNQLVQSDVLQVTVVTTVGGGQETRAMLAVATTGRADVVADAIATWDESTSVVVTAGQYDLLVEFVCQDRLHLLDIINRVRAFDEVATTETFVYLDLKKQLHNRVLPVP